MKNLIAYYNEHKVESILLTSILAVAAFLRLYQVDRYMRFLGDEGRDALVVMHMLRNLDFPLIGPGTSVGNMYMGPLYYYMMAMPMAVTGINPIAAAVMVAILGVVTVYLIYYIGKLFYSSVAGLIAAALYAVSYLPVTTAKSSWNPYPLPFFAVLIILALFKLIKGTNPRWLLLVAIAAAFAFQMHPLSFVLIPFIGLVYLYAGWLYYKANNLKPFLVYSAVSLGVFLLLMSPLAIFDLKHDFLNYKAYTTFLTNRETTVNLNPVHTTDKLNEIYTSLYIGRFLTYNWLVGMAVAAVALVPAIFLACYFAIKQKKDLTGLLLVVLWMTIGIIGLTLIKSHVYDHYFGFVSPALYILVGLILGILWKQHVVFKGLAVLVFVALMTNNLINHPLQEKPNSQFYRTEKVAKFILDQAHNRPYNFALISQNNYDAGYRFFFEFWKKPSVVIDPQHLTETQTDQLYVVCEDQECQPINHRNFEIAAYGWATIEQTYDIDGLKVFKLVKAQQPTQ